MARSQILPGRTHSVSCSSSCLCLAVHNCVSCNPHSVSGPCCSTLCQRHFSTTNAVPRQIPRVRRQMYHSMHYPGRSAAPRQVRVTDIFFMPLIQPLTQSWRSSNVTLSFDNLVISCSHSCLCLLAQLSRLCNPMRQYIPLQQVSRHMCCSRHHFWDRMGWS